MQLYLLVNIIMLIRLFIFPSFSIAGTLTLTWDKVPSTDLAGYKIYYDIQSRFDLSNKTGTYNNSPYAPVILQGDMAFPEYTFLALPPGTYYFAVTAYDTSNNESNYSDELMVVIPSPPALLWVSDLPEYTTSGVYPSSGYRDTVFRFRVMYKDVYNTPSQGGVFLYLDINGDGDYIDTGEQILTIPEDPLDTNYIDGRIYYVETSIPFLPQADVGTTNIRYKFVATTGTLSAEGIAAMDTNGPSIFQTLSLIVSTGNLTDNKSRDTGLSKAGDTKLIGPIAVTNDGDGIERLSIMMLDQDDKKEWQYSTTATGENRYILSGLFAGQGDKIILSDFNEGGGEDIITTTLQIADLSRFTCSKCSASGLSLLPASTIYLWLRLDMPQIVSGTWFDQLHTLTLNIEAVIP